MVAPFWWWEEQRDGKRMKGERTLPPVVGSTESLTSVPASPASYLASSLGSRATASQLGFQGWLKPRRFCTPQEITVLRQPVASNLTLIKSILPKALEVLIR